MPNALYRVPDDLRNALSGPQDVMGMDPNVNRLSLLPRYSAKEGVVAPQWLYDLARAAMAPGNALMGHQTTPEEAFNFAGNVQLGGFGASAVMRDPAPGPGRTIPLTTYHGSPHRINNVTPDAPYGRFDMSKIGTGEGAQAYGHGVYLAESPGVAKGYATKLSDRQVFIDGELIGADGAIAANMGNQFGVRPLASADTVAGSLLSKKGDLEAAISSAEDFAKRGHKSYARLAEELKALRGKNIEIKSPGHFYTVDLPDSHIANMLDWDAPLSQQPEAVRRMSESLRIPARTLKKLNAEDVSEFVGFHSDGTGEDFYNVLTDPLGVNMTDQAASKVLRDAGIPGIKYFDGGSRAAGEGTRNFVIFDPAIAQILSRE